MRLHKRLLTLAPFACTAGLVLGAAASGASASLEPVPVSIQRQSSTPNRQTRAPEFTLTLLDGRRLSSTSLAGKTVVLDFWGTWCPPCQAATPILVSFANKYAADPDFVMIGVSADEPKDEKLLRDYIAKHRMNWMQYFDSPQRLASQFQIDDFPTYLVLDGKGNISERLLGWPRAAKGSTVPAGTSVLGALESAVKKSLKQGRK